MLWYLLLNWILIHVECLIIINLYCILVTNVRIEFTVTLTCIFFCQEMVIKFQDLQIEHTAKLNEMKTKRKRLCLFPNRWVLSTSVIDLTYTSMFFQLMGRDKSTKTSSWNIQKNSRKQKIRYRCDVTHLLTFYFKNWTHFHWFRNGVLLEGIYLGNYISYNLPLLPLIIL